jgi:hypothetical protein
MGVMELNGNDHRFFYGKDVRKEATRKTQTWEKDNINMDVREICWDSTNWIDVVENRVQWRTLVNTVMNFQFP